MSFFDLSNPHLYIAIVLACVNGALMCFAAYKFLQMIQLSSYKVSGYFSWLKTDRAKYASRLVMLAFLSSACILITNALFDSYQESQLYSYFGLIFYFYFTIIFTQKMFNAPKKTPLKQTYRMTRLCVLLFIVAAIESFFFIAFSSIILPIFKFGAICLVPPTMIILVPLVHLLLVPFENINNKRYVFLAKKKLKKFPNLIKIGITGSYGKTSVKNILNVMLSEKFNVCVSPHNFNTPMGLTKVVLDYLKPQHEVLITEMGARAKGEIKELCDIIKPQHGILTAIGNQHFATFGSLENIKLGKFELIESLSDEGIAIFNKDNLSSTELYERARCQKYYASLNDTNASCYASEFQIDNEGISFYLHLNDAKVKCNSILLGEHNLQNIIICACFASKMGLTINEIKAAIEKLKPVPHRLELKINGSVTILDDSYNSSVEGSQAALKVLSQIEGNEKIVVTPGLVELGELEKEENVNLGKNIAKVATKVIIVNKANYEEIKKGLTEANFSEENIFEAETLTHAQLILSKMNLNNAVVIFENDLPDNYI